MSSWNVKPNPHHTFRGFTVDPAYAFAFQAARVVARRPAGFCNPLLLFGDEGLGKTHLIQAIANECRKTRRQSVLILSADSFLNHYIEALQRRTFPAFRRRFKRLDMLLIDDIHFLRNRESTSEELSFLIGMVQDNGGQIVATSAYPITKMNDMCGRLMAKFEHSLSAEVRKPGPACRLAILRALQKKQKTTINDRLLRFIAENIDSSTRRLIGAYVRASSCERLLKQPLTLPILRRLLQDLLPESASGQCLSPILPPLCGQTDAH